MKHDPITPDGKEAIADYTPVQLAARSNGWTAERQRVFLAALAETGSVSTACIAAGITARSAYRLRADPRGAAFAAAWHRALYVATHAMVALAFERATRGTYRETWKNDELVSVTRQPSDTMLKFLLTRLMPSMFAAKPQDNWDSAWYAQHHLPGLLDKLADCDVPADRLSHSDFEFRQRNREIDPPVAPGTEEASWSENIGYDPGRRGDPGETPPASGPENDGPDCYPPRTVEDRAKDYMLPDLDEDEEPDLDDDDFGDEDFEEDDDDGFDDDDDERDEDEDFDDDEEEDEEDDDAERSAPPRRN